MVPTYDPDPVDEGLTQERTDLAWNRSGLAFVACIAVLLRRIWPLRGADQIVALACISAGAFAWSHGHVSREDRRKQDKRGAMASEPEPGHRHHRGHSRPRPRRGGAGLCPAQVTPPRVSIFKREAVPPEVGEVRRTGPWDE